MTAIMSSYNAEKTACRELLQDPMSEAGNAYSGGIKECVCLQVVQDLTKLVLPC